MSVHLATKERAASVSEPGYLVQQTPTTNNMPDYLVQGDVAAAGVVAYLVQGSGGNHAAADGPCSEPVYLVPDNEAAAPDEDVNYSDSHRNHSLEDTDDSST